MRNAKKTLSLVMVAIFTTFIVLSGIPAGAVTTAAAKAQVTKATAAVVKVEKTVKVATFNPTTAQTQLNAAAKEVAKVKSLGKSYVKTYSALAARDVAVSKKIAARKKAIAAAAAAVAKVYANAEAAVVAAEKATDSDSVDLSDDAALAAAQGTVTTALELIVKLNNTSSTYKGLMARIDAANNEIVKAMDAKTAAEEAAKAEADAKAKAEADAKALAEAVAAADKAVAAVEAAPLATAADLTAALELGKTAATAVAAVTDAEKVAAFTARLKVVADKGEALKTKLAADAEALKVANLVAVSAVDGTITVTLDKKATTTVTAADFAVKVAVGTTTATAVTVSKVEVVSDKEVKLTVPAITATTADQKVVYTVAYLAGTAMDANFTVAALAVPIKTLTAVVKSQQALVGADTTVSVKALDADGKPVVNGDVTFNVKQTSFAANSTVVLNPTYVETAKTNADGIASIKVNRANPYDDTIDMYSTVNPTVRTSAYIYNGVTARLTVTSADGNSIANGSYKTYSVALKTPTGGAVEGAKVYVAFKENLTGVQGTSAVVAQNAAGSTVTPFQTPTGQNAIFYVVTDANGTANFVLKGNNTNVTPVVYYTTTQAAIDEVYSTSYLHVDLAPVTFIGAQSGFGITFTETTPIVSTFGAANGHLYTVNVKSATGAPYVNGTVTVGLNENIDNVITTNTDAIITDEDGVAMTFVGQPTGVTLALDSTGSASFYVIDTNTIGLNPTATPIVWIDQNFVSNVQGRLETTEPFAVGPNVTFRTETIAGVTMTQTNKPTAGNYIATPDLAGLVTVIDTALLDITVINQDGNDLTTPIALSNIAQVTWKIVNNSDAPITVTTNLGSTLVAALNTTNVTGATGTLAVKTSYATSAVIVSAVVTLANNSSFIVPEQTLSFTKVARQVLAGEAVTGTVLAYDLHDAAVAGLVYQAGTGRIIVKLDGTNQVVAVNYDGTNTYKSGLADVATSYASYNTLTDDSAIYGAGYTDVDKFEKLLTVGDRVFVTAAGIVHLQNVDNSAGQTPSGANGYAAPVVVVPTVHSYITATTATPSVAAAAGKYYTNALPANYTGGFTATAGAGTPVVVAVNNATPAQVAAAINAAAAAVAPVSTIVATVVGSQVVISSSVVTDAVALTASTNTTYVPNQVVAATAPVVGVYNAVINAMIPATTVVTVGARTYVAGTAFAIGLDVDAEGANLAAVINADAASLYTAAYVAATNTLVLTEKVASGSVAVPTVDAGTYLQ